MKIYHCFRRKTHSLLRILGMTLENNIPQNAKLLAESIGNGVYCCSADGYDSRRAPRFHVQKM